LQHLSILGDCCWFVSQCLTFFPPKQVRNPIAGHPEQPCGNLLHRLDHPVGLHQFVENILQDVFRIIPVRHTSANEVAKPGLLPIHRFSNTLILLRHHPWFSQRFFHLL
jgi:hypothetical protein